MDTSAAAAGVGGGIAFGGRSSGSLGTVQFASMNGLKENGNADFSGALIFTTRKGTDSLTEKLRITSSGNVGIGTTSPRGRLDVNGAIVSTPATQVTNPTGTTEGVDFAKGNVQYTNESCGNSNAFRLLNLKDGGSYTLAVLGTTQATCVFSAFSDTGSNALTVKLPSDHGNTISNKVTLYNFLVIGTNVFVSWIPGYQ
jgi:hypothetical protein